MSGDEQREQRADQRDLQKRLKASEKHLDDQLSHISATVLGHDTTLSHLQNNMTTDDHGRGANVPLIPFSGGRNEDFSQYLKQFELICNANNYKPDKRAQILASYLRDKAFYVYDSLPDATKTDYDALKKAMLEKFQTTDQNRYLHQKFKERRQGYSENVMEYGCDLHRLGMAALSKVDPEQRDHLIREKFLAGLRPEYHKLIVYSNPKNFHNAMTLAERLEGLQPGEREETVKHTLLLEGIQKKLENLEMAREYPPADNNAPFPAYAVADSSPRGQPFRTGGAYLNNFRQTIGPHGNRCFRCNRSGHIARNCPQGFSPRSIICRLCNRAGHFVRDCQRRLPPARRPNAAGRPRSYQQSRGPAAYNRAAPQPRFAGPPFPSSLILQQSQRIMTVRQQQQPPAEEPTWQPLVAGVVSQPSHESRTKKIRTSVDAQVQVHIRGQDPLEPTTKPCPVPTSVETAGRSQKNRDGTEKRTKVPFLTTMFACRPAVTRVLLLLLLAIAYTHIISVGAYTVMKDDEDYSVDPHRLTSPMICQAQESRILWRLPETFSCPGGNHTAHDEVIPTAMKLFKRNFIQYKSDAWKCIKITEEMETYTYFFGDENLKREKKYQEAVSAEECVAMKQFQRCHNPPMAYQGGIYQTNNKLNWYYPGGGINCCHWKKFKVSNCYLYRTSVYKKHSNPIMESGAGDVSKCLYAKGQCIMEDGAFLLWNVNNRSFCEVLRWKTVPGKMFGTSWLSDDSNLALTFTQKRTTTDCQNLPLKLSDQGIAVRMLPTPNTRTRRSVQYGGFVSSAQLAASLEALELKWKQNMNFAFSHALNSVCNFMKSVVELLKAQILANPTMAVRALINQFNIFVKAGGDMLEIFPCNELDHTLQTEVRYKFLSMNGSCSAQIPIKFQLHKQDHKGYMDPVTNIIHRYSVPMDCRLIKQIPVKIQGWYYLYQSETGRLKRVKNIPPLKVLHWNTEAMIDVKATIYHEIIFYGWDELESHISLNDVLGSLNKPREVLRHLGITEEDEDPVETAGKAASSILNTGYFGFLHGLAANAYQIWTFCVCLYVTVGVLIIHFFPINAMPAGLNMANGYHRIKATWSRWRRRERLRYEATGEHLPQRMLNARWSSRHRNGKSSVTNVVVGSQDSLSTANRTHYPLLPNAPATDRISTLNRGNRSTLQQEAPQLNSESGPLPFRINATTNETTITAILDGLQVQCLIDSGSNLTIIPYKIAKHLKNPITKGPITAVSMTEHQLPIIGEVNGIIRLGNKDMCGRIVVASKTPYDLIIGTDLMKQLGEIRFDFQKQTIQLGSEVLPMSKTTRPAAVYLCYCSPSTVALG